MFKIQKELVRLELELNVLVDYLVLKLLEQNGIKKAQFQDKNFVQI